MSKNKNNLTIDLKAKQDFEGRTFYVGKIKAPVLIDASNGITFLCFIADQGCEQLQIAVMDNSKKENKEQDDGNNSSF